MLVLDLITQKGLSPDLNPLWRALDLSPLEWAFLFEFLFNFIIQWSV